MEMKGAYRLTLYLESLYLLFRAILPCFIMIVNYEEVGIPCRLSSSGVGVIPVLNMQLTDFEGLPRRNWQEMVSNPAARMGFYPQRLVLFSSLSIK